MRWPSTESVAKVLNCTNTTVKEFAAILLGREPEQGLSGKIPMISMQTAAAGTSFDDAGFPTGDAWREITFPSQVDSYSYALEVSGDDLLPVYRRGDLIVVSPDSSVRAGDRVVVRNHDCSLNVCVLRSHGAADVEFTSVEPSVDSWLVPARDIDWMSRIVWASQ